MVEVLGLAIEWWSNIAWIYTVVLAPCYDGRHGATDRARLDSSPPVMVTVPAEGSKRSR